MVLGLIQYRIGQPHLGDIGHLRTDKTPEEVAALSKKFFGSLAAVVAAVAAFAFLVSNGTIAVSIIADRSGARLQRPHPGGPLFRLCMDARGPHP